ncbi:AEC family transporter [Rhizobium sp. CFBP 8762]|uniref:AEC family transporter n=1 Tax=Rhizobium sp. CFBP 8762 TaxID=2775279 RepID=UPI00177D1A6D|nr:AEC family transporter [Rhizobium sp. CFBP 8762]MBD8555366.1 AEC family transporter [Rhizobium sp. CFBP 8762]
MSEIALNVLPVFILIFLGWGVVRIGYLSPSVGDGLGDFVFRIAVPVLLFGTIAQANFQSGSPWLLWVAYFGGVAVTWALGELIATRLFKRDARIGVLAGVSSSFANNIFIGLPLVTRVVGEDGIVALSVLLSVHLPVMMIAGTILMERAERKATGRAGKSVPQVMLDVGRNLIRNPLIIGLSCGALVNISGLPFGGTVKIVTDQITAVAAPAALVSIGMALVKYGVSGNLGLATVTTALKLIVLPAAVFAFSTVVGLSPQWAAALVLTASVPTGVNAWLIANHFNVGHGLASSTITMTTMLGVVSVSAWTYFLM